ncbi:BNR repeat-like domain protein [Thermoplasmatales archaeon SCGC AB-539-N05]|nr:BNR repeat-like domain protein [Thermoplasmatales archaeon SCGC AB-539-N05]
MRKIRSKKSTLALLVTFALLFEMGIVTAQSQQTGDIVRLTTDKPSAESPAIAVNGSTLHVVWSNDFFPESGGSDIYYKQSSDNGKTWSDDARLTHVESESAEPSIGANGNNIHIVWQDTRHSGTNREIYYKVSRDNGITWSDDIRLTDAQKRSSEPWLAVNGDAIYVTWMDYRLEGSEIYFKMSEDNGYTWSNDTRLTFNPAPSYLPVVGVYNNNLHIIWQDNREGGWGIYYKKSENNGKNWTDAIRISGYNYTSAYSHMCVNKESIYVVWVDHRGSREIYYKFSNNNGDSWSEDKRLTYTDNVSTDPYVEIYGDTVYVTWEDYRNGVDPEIYYNVGLNYGETWSDDIRLTNTTDGSIDPCLASNNEGIYVLWSEEIDYTYELYYHQIQTHMLNINSINFSKTAIQPPDSISIHIKGLIDEENVVDLQCNAQYRSPSGNWTDLPVKLVKVSFIDQYVSNLWEVTLAFDKEAEAGSYDFRAKLIPQSGNESQWFESLGIINVYKTTKEDNVPGFDLSVFIFSVVFLLLWIRKHRLEL